MMFEYDINSQKKISSEFETRLARLDPHQKVHVIVLLQLNTAEKTRGTRQTRLERQAIIQLVQDSAAKALEHIAGTIQRFDGHSLIDRPDLIRDYSDRNQCCWNPISCRISCSQSYHRRPINLSSRFIAKFMRIQ
jgi:hypothetical protein